MDLCVNKLTGTIPNLTNLVNLTKLDFNDNMISGSLPSEIGTFTKLETLLLSENELTGAIPAEFGNLYSLEYLFLFENDLSGCYYSNLKNLCTQIIEYNPDGQDIDFGNNFDASWVDFCASDAGICLDAAAICNSAPELNIDGLQFEEASYHSAQKISSNAIIEATTTFKAGETIELQSGFETNGLNDFRADIENCE